MIDALIPIDSDTALASVLNAYMRGLSTIDIMTQPHDCMAVVMADFDKSPKTKDGKMIRRMAQDFYELVSLRKSLRDYEWTAKRLLDLLDRFFNEYQGDADLYAIENRIRCIDEYGSDDESDWFQDGENGNGPIWKVTTKDAKESAIHHGIMYELAYYFPGNGDRHECMGSSEIKDYQRFTLLVRKQTDMSFGKMFASFFKQPIPIYRMDANGDMAPLSMADQIESEINEDIENASISEAFDAVIFAGNVANSLFVAEMDEALKLSALHALMRRLIAGDIKNLPSPFIEPAPLF